MSQMEQIEAAARDLAERCAALDGLRRNLNADIEAIVKPRVAQFAAATDEAAQAHKRLHALIDQSRGLFNRPRTVVLHGIKLGLQKGKGRIDFDDEDKAMQRIQRLLPEQAASLIGCKHFLVRAAIAMLPVADIKRIGGSVVGADDAVFIKPERTIAAGLVDALVTGYVNQAGE